MRECSGNNEKGLTLVEVLAALVILGILFVGIMTIFPQMTLFNEKTEAKLDTMNLARQEMATIVAEDQNTWAKLLISSADIVDTNLPDYLSDTKIMTVMESPEMGYTFDADFTSAKGNYKRFKKKVGTNLFEADVYLTCEPYLSTGLIGDEETPAAGACPELAFTKLYKVHLKVYKISDTNPVTKYFSSETFSFIAYRAYFEEPVESTGG